MLGEQAIFAMKPGSFLINCAHRDLVDEMALCRALEQGHLPGQAWTVLTRKISTGR